MHSDRSGAPRSHQEVHITPQGIRSDLNGYGSGSQLMVSKPFGVWTTWCVGVDTQKILRTQPGKQSSKSRGCIVIAIAMVDDKSLELNNSTRSQGKEGECLPGNLNLANLILSADGQGGRTCWSLYC